MVVSVEGHTLPNPKVWLPGVVTYVPDGGLVGVRQFDGLVGGLVDSFVVC